MSPRRADPTTIPEAIARAAAEWPDKEALVTPDRRMTYAELHAATERVASALIARGVEKGLN